MKKYLLILLAAMAFVACEKEDFSPQTEQPKDPLADVIRIAQEGAAMLEDATTRTSVARRIDRGRISCKVKPATRAGESDDTLYYVVNYADNAGFAIVSADEQAPDGARLIAVTESGNYTAGETTDNEGFNMYMDMVELTDFRDDLVIDTTILVPKNSYYKDVSTYSSWYGTNPKVSVKWGQGQPLTINPAYPYNKYCLDSDTNTLICPAGCVAVAIAQIMSYHRKPASYMLTYDGSDRIIPLDWNALNSYIGGHDYNWTSSAGDAIALWFREIGKRAGMKYTTEGSGTGNEEARTCLYTFGYEQLPAIDYSYAKIKSELQANRPVYMRGERLVTESNGTTEYKGHAWVADGYKYRTRFTETYEVFPSPLGEEYDRWVLRNQVTTEYRYVHYNWGYDGDCNGYFSDGCFKLNNASSDAGGYDNSGSNSLNRDYCYNVQMVTGIANYHTY